MGNLADDWAAELAARAKALSKETGVPTTVLFSMVQPLGQAALAEPRQGAEREQTTMAKMTAEDIALRAARITQAVTGFQAQARALLDNADFSREYKNRRLGELQTSAYASALADAQALFGPKGSFLPSLAAAKERLGAARNAAELALVPDPNRVLLAQQRLMHILNQPGMDVAKARRWFNQEASQAEKAALALTDEKTIAERMMAVDAPMARDLVRTARQWYDNSLQTPEVQSAMRQMERMDQVGQEAIGAVHRAALALGDTEPDGFWRPRGEGDLIGTIAGLSRSVDGEWTQSGDAGNGDAGNGGAGPAG